MAVPTINGKPSLFITPEAPTSKAPNYFSSYARIATEMATETEPKTEAEQIDAECYMSAEEEAHLCSQYDAEVAELASLGGGARHYIAGHDAVWQEGGEI